MGALAVMDVLRVPPGIDAYYRIPVLEITLLLLSIL